MIQYGQLNDGTDRGAEFISKIKCNRTIVLSERGVCRRVAFLSGKVILGHCIRYSVLSHRVESYRWFVRGTREKNVNIRTEKP